MLKLKMKKNSNTLWDPTVPSKLKKIQQWFGEIITRPINCDNSVSPISPSGNPIEEEAKCFIKPNHYLKAHERAKIYTEQYWWRLLGHLHEIFPLLCRLFGYEAFNRQIGVPYLSKYPPNDWSLNSLGSRLPEWIEKYYSAPDKLLLLDIATLECAFNDCFVDLEYKTLDLEALQNEADQFEKKKLYLQPHLYLFKMNYDLFSFREEMIKQEGNFWVDHDFPPLNQEREFYFIIFRSQANDVCWEEISQGEHLLLSSFQDGSSISALCSHIEKEPPPLDLEMSENLGAWFQKWGRRRWLSTSSPRLPKDEDL